jgi:hypothetical protein
VVGAYGLPPMTLSQRSLTVGPWTRPENAVNRAAIAGPRVLGALLTSGLRVVRVLTVVGRSLTQLQGAYVASM